MLIKELLARLAGKSPDDELDVKSLEETESESAPESSPESDQSEEVKEEQPVQDEKVEEQSVEEVIEEKPVEESKVEEEAKEDSSAEVEALKAKLAEMEAAKAEAEAAKSEAESKIAELKISNDELAKAKSEADAKAKLDKAIADGWLTPGQLKEAENQDSVFVDLAKNHPELFDRLALVMAPKVLRKPGVTEAPADQSGAMTEDELVAKIKKLAAEKGISYAQAAQLF